MLTNKQKHWVSQLSNVKKVKIIPYDSKVKKIFEIVKTEIVSFLGSAYDGRSVEVLHKGATSMEISGKGDVDIYVPVPPSMFNSYLKKLTKLYGQSPSIYHLERVRWNKIVENIEVEIFLINKKHKAWTECVLFEDYLKKHPKALTAYETLKQEADGVSSREYYTRKLEFMNSILTRAKKISSSQNSRF